MYQNQDPLLERIQRHNIKKKREGVGGRVGFITLLVLVEGEADIGIHTLIQLLINSLASTHIDWLVQ